MAINVQKNKNNVNKSDVEERKARTDVFFQVIIIIIKPLSALNGKNTLENEISFQQQNIKTFMLPDNRAGVNPHSMFYNNNNPGSGFPKNNNKKQPQK